MLGLPPLPPWSGAHPIIVHFPIALLSIAPVLVLLAIVARTYRLQFMVSALVLLAFGTLGAFLATWSGDATEHAIKMSREMHGLVHEHEEAAELARNIFIGITAAFAMLTLGVWKVERVRKLGAAALVLILLTQVGGALVLANAGHLGGMLVHEHGLRAPMGNAQASPDAGTPLTQPAAAENDAD